MILVTVGTDPSPFNRLMTWIDELLIQGLITEEVVVQYGSCTVLPAGARVYQTVRDEQLRELMSQARLVVSHCDESMTLLLEEFETPFILVPRSPQLKEQVDRQQLEMAAALAEIHVPIAWCPGDLVRFLANPFRVTVTHLSRDSSQALCRSLQQRFQQLSV